VKSPERGECMAFFYIEIEDGAPVSFQVICNFMGPLIMCHNPIVDYGLVKVNSHTDFEIEIENTGPIPAEILIKNSNNYRLNFTNMVSAEQDSPVRGNRDSSTASLVYDKPIKTIKGNKITLDAYNLYLKPYEKQIILVSMKTLTPEKVEEYFEIMVRDGQSQFFQIHSQVQRPMVSLNRAIMNLGRIYAGVQEYINPQSKH
jgi:hypothetical protein